MLETCHYCCCSSYCCWRYLVVAWLMLLHVVSACWFCFIIALADLHFSCLCFVDSALSGLCCVSSVVALHCTRNSYILNCQSILSCMQAVILQKLIPKISLAWRLHPRKFIRPHCNSYAASQRFRSLIGLFLNYHPRLPPSLSLSLSLCSSLSGCTAAHANSCVCASPEALYEQGGVVDAEGLDRKLHAVALPSLCVVWMAAHGAPSGPCDRGWALMGLWVPELFSGPPNFGIMLEIIALTILSGIVFFGGRWFCHFLVLMCFFASKHVFYIF